tara:strand:- start:22618 stop:22959 length:342 start_codon:yes stop_codon:yes gene_type:complete
MLAEKEIIPAKKGSAPYSLTEAQSMLEKVGEPWHLNEDATKIHVSYKFKNFKRALQFVNELGMIADAAMHHPDIQLGWGYVNLEIQTHSIGGVQEADFVLAAKSQRIYEDCIA